MVCARGSNADVAAAATITDLQQASKALQGKGRHGSLPCSHAGAAHCSVTPTLLRDCCALLEVQLAGMTAIYRAGSQQGVPPLREGCMSMADFGAAPGETYLLHV